MNNQSATGSQANPIQTYFGQLEKLINKGLYAIKKAVSHEGKLAIENLDQHQQGIYDLAFCFAELKAAENFNIFATQHGAGEQKLANLFAAECFNSILTRLKRAPTDIGLEFSDFNIEAQIMTFTNQQLCRSQLNEIGKDIAATNGQFIARGLETEKQMMADTFHEFAKNVVEPWAEKIHRENLMIPDEILNGLKALGCFGLSVPEQYGGLLPDDAEDNLGMIVVTEELSRASLGGAGSLITRPEIMARALIEGGTATQKDYWLPKLAAGEPLCGISITEPDYGSDVASIKLQATKVNGGWSLQGAKAWSTFAGKAGVLLVLARTNPDLSIGHKGLSLFIVEKPTTDEHHFKYNQETGGVLEGTSIATVAYRGMHSFQLFFDDFFVPDSHLLGGEHGIGKGFYFTMRGFMGGRIQTAARACGVMQAAFDRAVTYTNERVIFGQTIANFDLTRAKLARMAASLAACRQYTYAVGRLMDSGEGKMEASLVKLLACKTAEWICREAMQLHGGMGYAEESDVSRYWLDARVLSIFEGTEETLALKVVGRHLVENAKH